MMMFFTTSLFHKFSRNNHFQRFHQKRTCIPIPPMAEYDSALSRDDFLAAALTVIQIENRFPVWQPPHKMDHLLEDILLRFCEVPKWGTISRIQKAKDEKLRPEHLVDLELK